MVIQPIMQIAAFTIIGTNLGQGSAGYYAIGNAIYVGARVALFSAAIAVAAERANRTLAIVLATPRNPLVIFSGRLLPPTVIGSASCTVMLAAAILCTGTGLSMPRALALVPVIVLICLACSAFGLMVGMIGLYLRDSIFLANVAMYAMLAFCGVNFSTGSSPLLIRTLGEILPLGFGLRSVRELFDGQSVNISNISAGLLHVVAYLLVAAVLLRVMERRARLRGTLDLSA
ncbi:ABC transporter permease [Streptomyces sp. NPDC057521]|uniref:ABC transporter permease n=1 Tax=Streptomyces sp. NPDC057521 TaxID=3346156 RepID=UPI0036ACF73E